MPTKSLIIKLNEQERKKVYAEVPYCAKCVEESDLYLGMPFVNFKAVEKGNSA